MTYFAEVIESSISTFTAQSWKWDSFPIFGSLVTVKTSDKTIFGLVNAIKTSSIDSSRTPIAYQKTEQELRQELPHIFEFLHTTFTCIIIGYREHNFIIQELAPQPAKIHAFVAKATDQELKEFFVQDHFLHMLFNYNHIGNLRDELLLALLRNLVKQKILTDEKLASFITKITLLTGNDYRHLKLFLQRVQPIVMEGPNV